ncbi:MAG: STN domain-containing protein, partial [Chitinophaga sp.]
MKLTFVLVFTALMSAAAAGRAQTVSLSKKSASLESVLYRIKAQTGYRLWFEAKLLKKAQRVDIDVKNFPLRKALDICFKDQPLTYEIIDQTIVVREADRRETLLQPLPRMEVTGIVKDAQGTPL